MPIIDSDEQIIAASKFRLSLDKKVRKAVKKLINDISESSKLDPLKMYDRQLDAYGDAQNFVASSKSKGASKFLAHCGDMMSIISNRLKQALQQIKSVALRSQLNIGRKNILVHTVFNSTSKSNDLARVFNRLTPYKDDGLQVQRLKQIVAMAHEVVQEVISGDPKLLVQDNVQVVLRFTLMKIGVQGKIHSTGTHLIKIDVNIIHAMSKFLCDNEPYKLRSYLKEFMLHELTHAYDDIHLEETGKYYTAVRNEAITTFQDLFSARHIAHPQIIDLQEYIDVAENYFSNLDSSKKLKREDPKHYITGLALTLIQWKVQNKDPRTWSSPSNFLLYPSTHRKTKVFLSKLRLMSTLRFFQSARRSIVELNQQSVYPNTYRALGEVISDIITDSRKVKPSARKAFFNKSFKKS